MARPKSNLPPDQFTLTEAAVVGAGLPHRTPALVQSKHRQLAPTPVAVRSGRGGIVFYDPFGVTHWALNGALYAVGIPLLSACRLGSLVADELGAAYAKLPSRLEDYLHKPFNQRHPNFPWPESSREKFLYEATGEFWLHHLLRTQTTIYQRGIVLRGDYCIEIVNREYVFAGFDWQGKLKTISPFGGPASDLSPEYRIVGWRRNDDPIEIRSIVEELPRGWSDSDAKALVSARTIEDEFHTARANAASLLRVNVSLAIRNAFDAIHDHRVQNEAKFDWDATIADAQRTGAGHDVHGRPLDPQHPWNSASQTTSTKPVA